MSEPQPPEGLSEEELKLFKKYGKLPKKPGILPGQRGKKQHFDSADWQLNKQSDKKKSDKNSNNNSQTTIPEGE